MPTDHFPTFKAIRHRIHRWLDRELEDAPLSGWQWRAGLTVQLSRHWGATCLAFLLIDACLPQSTKALLLLVVARLPIVRSVCVGDLWLICNPRGLYHRHDCWPVPIWLYESWQDQYYTGIAFPLAFLMLVTPLTAIRWWRRNRASSLTQRASYAGAAHRGPNH